MALTLANDLTGLVSREVDAAGRYSSALGESLSTGNDKLVEVVDGFLGNSLRDSEIILGAIAKNTAYSINLLTITDEYLKTIAGSLQEGLKNIGAAGPLSTDKLAVLQKNLDDKRTQVSLLIQTADFDGKSLLGGGANSIDVQVGLSVTDKINVAVNDFSTGKIFRSSITTAINEYIKDNKSNTISTYYDGSANATRYADALLANDNLIYNATTTATTAERMTSAQFAALLNALPATKKTLLDQVFLADANNLATTDLVTNGFAEATLAQFRVASDGLLLQRTALAPILNAANATSIFGPVANGADADATAVATAAHINAFNLPQSVKDAVTAAADVGGFASDDAARNDVRTAAYDALIASGTTYEAYLRAHAAPANFNAAAGVALGAVVAVAAYQTAIGTTSTTLNAGVRAVGATTAAANIADAMDDVLGAMFLNSEFVPILMDNAATYIKGDDALANVNTANRIFAQDVFQNALDTIRGEQATVANSKSNVIEASDALRATTNVTQKAADSYLKTDYVQAAQQYAETLRTMVASVTALQAANKIPEVAQRLLDGLTR